jgi:hypothetical protein
MTVTHRATCIRPLVLALGLALSGSVWADAVTDQAKSLIEAGNSTQAFELLMPLESARAGEEAYDLLLGIAALDSGRHTRAILALERVLAVNPDNVRARAEIARAYFAVGEPKTAREEFEIAKKQGVPEEVAKTIEKFLAAVERVEDEGRTTIKSFVEASIGWDSNVNGATSDSSVAIPGFGSFALEGANAKQSDGYLGASAGVNVRVPLDARLAVVAGMLTNKRMNDTWSQFDNGSWEGNVGLVVKNDKDVYSATLQAGTNYVENDRYRDVVGLGAQWQHNYDQRNQATVFVQFNDYRYPGSANEFVSNPRNAQRWVAGAGFAHALADFKTVFYGSVYAGAENAPDQPTAALDYRLHGLRGGGQYQLSGDIALFASLSFEERKHLDIYGGYGVDRDDATTTAALGLVYSLGKHWKFTPQYQYGQNRSNINYFAYSRESYSMTARYEF